MKRRVEIEIWADGMARVVESEPIAGDDDRFRLRKTLTFRIFNISTIAGDGGPQPAPVTAQAEPEAAADSSYGETVKLDRNSSEFESRKAELKELGYKWDRKEKVWRKPTDPKTVNDSRKSVRLRVRKVIQIFAIAMLAGMS